MQQGPTYPTKADSHVEIQNYLQTNYPDTNIWPVIWHKLSNQYQKGYNIELATFEVNNKSILNQKILTSTSALDIIVNSKLETHYLDFITPSSSRSLTSGYSIPSFLSDNIQFTKNTYELVTNNTYNTQKLTTIDIDYLWKTSNEQVKAMEVTTFYKDLSDIDEAKRLLSISIEKRFSKPNAYHLRFIADVAQNIYNAKLYFVCVNTVPNSNNIKSGSNVLWFELTPKVADDIHNRIMPNNSLLHFDTFNNFLSNL